MMNLVFVILLSSSLFTVFGGISLAKERSADQSERATTSSRWKNIKGDDRNTVSYRLFRETEYGPGKKVHNNIIPGTTMFLVSIYHMESMTRFSHKCIFLVKGNLTLKQIKNGKYSDKDIINVDCTTNILEPLGGKDGK